MRKLASVRRIFAIDPIVNADAIEVATVDGWKVVVKKNEFQVGDLIVYFEIDSWIPLEIAPFLTQKGQEPKIYEGVIGNRLRTVKLRGQISQGLVVPLGSINIDWKNEYKVEGFDLTDILGIKKWEAPIPAQLAGLIKGGFPSFIRKTDQERIQNMIDEVFGEYANEKFEVTVKLDGTSCTIYNRNGEFGVCSRNFEFKINNENKDNSLVRIAIDSGLSVALNTIGRNVAIQGELMGPGIQGNRENLKNTILFIFDIFDIDQHSYLNSVERLEFVDRLITVGVDPFRVIHVPIITYRKPFRTIEKMLAFADGPSYTHNVREGLVWKSISNPNFSFKTISNKFLLSEK